MTQTTRAARPIRISAGLCAMLLLGVAGATAQVGPPPPPPPPPSVVSGSLAATGTGAISGVITDAITGRPVPGATVTLGNTAALGAPLPRALTDSRGRFVFRDLPASDSYYLSASGFGYAATRYGWTGPNGSTLIRDILKIPVSDGQWVSTIGIPLWRLGSISGRILDERGEPVVGIAARVFSTGNVAGHSQLLAGTIAVTDDRGVYRIDGLEPGRYMVGVLSVQSTVLDTTPESPQRRAMGELESGGIGGGNGASVSAPGIDVDGRHRLVLTHFATPPPPSAGQARAYPPVFYPAARSTTDATAIEIGYGDIRNGIDLQLAAVTVFKVSGRLDGFAGAAPQLLLRLLPAGSERLGFGSEAATTVVEPDGRFTFLNVPDGNYTILAQASVMDFTTGSASLRLSDAPGFPAGGISVGSYDGAPGLSFLARNGQDAPNWGRAQVSVGGRDVDDVVVGMHPTVALRGRIVFAEDTKPPAGARMLLRVMPANGDPALGSPFAMTETDGTFRFTFSGLLGGTYLLTGFGSYVAMSILWQGRDLIDTGFDASSGRDFDDIVATVTDKRASVTGTVSDRRARVDAAVIAFPVERARWTDFGWTPRQFLTAVAASSGAYQLSPLPAGDYYLIAVDSSKKDAWVDAKFLAAAAPLAVRVTLKWGDKVTQDLAVREVVIK